VCHVIILLHHLFSLSAAAPLTVEAVTEAVKEVDWKGLCWYLYVPYSKGVEIEKCYPANCRRKELVAWWLSTDPAPCWRRLIHRLDFWDATAIADKIRHNAEPVQGMWCPHTRLENNSSGNKQKFTKSAT